MSIAESNSVVPENLRRIMGATGIKRCVVAEKAGLSYQQFTHMLNGQTIIRPCDVIAFADILHVPVGELFERPTKKE